MFRVWGFEGGLGSSAQQVSMSDLQAALNPKALNSKHKLRALPRLPKPTPKDPPCDPSLGQGDKVTIEACMSLSISR